MMKKNLDDVISKLYKLKSQLDGSDNRSSTVKECIDSLSDIQSRLDSFESVLRYFAQRCSDGKIREIPCSPGDTIYFIDIIHGKMVGQYTCGEILITSDAMRVSLVWHSGSMMYLPIEAFGNYAFTDYDEAQKRCAEIQKLHPPKVAE